MSSDPVNHLLRFFRLIIPFIEIIKAVISVNNLQWSDASNDMLLAIASSPYTTTNNTLYIFGEFAIPTYIYTARYNAQTSNFIWSDLPNEMPHAFWCGSQCAVSIKDSPLIYIVAPYLYEYESSGELRNGDTFIFNTITNQWIDDVTVPNTPIGINRPCVTYNHDDNKIYVIGGYSEVADVNITDTFQIYHLSSNTWTEASVYPIIIANQGCVYYNSFVYSFGGVMSHNPNEYSNEVYKYSILSDVWQSIATFDEMEGRSRTRCILATDYQIYAIGGENDVQTFGDVYVLNPMNDEFTKEPDTVYANHGVSASFVTNIDDRITVFGGDSDQLMSTGRQTQRLTLSPSSFPSKMPTISPTNIPTSVPSSSPTSPPSNFPTSVPSSSPTSPPSNFPTFVPTSSPTSPPSSLTIATMHPSPVSKAPVQTVSPTQYNPSLVVMIPSSHKTSATQSTHDLSDATHTTYAADVTDKLKTFPYLLWIIYAAIGCAVVWCLIGVCLIIKCLLKNRNKEDLEDGALKDAPSIVLGDVIASSDTDIMNDSVIQFLTNLNQTKYIETFASNEIYSMGTVKALSSDDLKEMIDTIGPRRVIWNAIEKLHQDRVYRNVVKIDERKEVEMGPNRAVPYDMFKRYDSAQQSSDRGEGEPKLIAQYTNNWNVNQDVTINMNDGFVVKFASDGEGSSSDDDVITKTILHPDNAMDKNQKSVHNDANMNDDFVVKSDSDSDELQHMDTIS